MSFRSPMGRARGRGSAHDGTGHWWAQRLTSIALVPLSLWFVASMVSLVGAPHAEVVAWMQAPVPAVLTVILVVVVFHHAQAGVQVIIEDYVHTEALKIASLVLVKFAAVVLAGVSVFAVLRIAFGG